MQKTKTIALIDCQSFYASVEKAAHPEYRDKPVIVADPERRSGIVLAACPLAKKLGATTASRVGDALSKCPDIIVIRPRMAEYIRVSMRIAEIYRGFTPLVEPWSIDEQFLDLTGSIKLFGEPEAIAKQIQNQVMQQTGVFVRAGISENKVLAKQCTDNFAKKHPLGIFTLKKNELDKTLWQLPIQDLYMVAGRMTSHFVRMGIRTIGDLAVVPLDKFKKMMRIRFGRNSDIQAEYYHNIANGIDSSLVRMDVYSDQKSIGAGRALQPHRYTQAWQALVMIHELCCIVGRRARDHSVSGYVISFSCATTEGWFHKQMTLNRATNIDDEIFQTAKHIFQKIWNERPISRLSVDLSGLVVDDVVQLDMFDDRDKQLKLLKTMDGIKDRFGDAAIMRASSLTEAGQAQQRATTIGGHYK